MQWMTDAIYALRGHHEPPEEKVFYEVLKYIPENATMLELGAYWGYYSLWFSSTIPGATNYLVEPIFDNLNVGKKNFALNNKEAHFYHAYVAVPGEDGGKDGVNFPGAKQILIDSFLRDENVEHLNILHADVQGVESDMLLSCVASVKANKIDYFFISTHTFALHHFCIDFLVENNYIILAEHSPAESCSCDGLVVARRKDVPGPNHVSIRKYP